MLTVHCDTLAARLAKAGSKSSQRTSRDPTEIIDQLDFFSAGMCWDVLGCAGMCWDVLGCAGHIDSISFLHL